MLYSYRAVGETGKPASGEREAGSERELAEALKREGLLLLEAEAKGQAQAGGAASRLSWLLGRVSLVERMAFARNLAVMISAGLSLTRALEALVEQSQNPRFRAVLADIRAGVVRGQSFADSLKPHERVFGALFLNMVRAGEVSGKLEYVLKVLSRQMQRDHDLRQKVRGAMIYPAVVVAALVSIGVLMMVWVVPTLTQTFSELGIDLPLATRLIIGGSDFLLAYYWYLLGLVAIATALAVRFRSNPAGRRALDRAILAAPVFGSLVQKLNSARFARTLASLISSGTPIARSLEVTASVLGNTHFREALDASAIAIQRGQPLHRILSGYPDLFPPMVIEMLRVGEETGQTSRMLLRLALFYEAEVAAITKNLSSIIEPVLMIAIGGVVGFFAVSMIQPIYSGLGNL